MIFYFEHGRFQGLTAFTTTKGDYDNMHIPFAKSQRYDNRYNRLLLSQKLGIEPDHLVFPHQCHSANVSAVNSLTLKKLNETDALITSTPGICLCIRTADCVPILFYDPANKVAGAAHAGWKGTLAGIGIKTVQVMVKDFLCKPENIYAAIGPSIGPDVYETGDEVVNMFMEKFNYANQILVRQKSGRYHLDLWTANKIQLTHAGIPLTQIEIARECTFSNPQKYFSARREGINTGRMVTGIML